MMKLIKKYSYLIITACFIFAFFSYITSKSPIVGDAYNYANIGLKTNPLTLARLAYFSWSGRFFSELWGFFMCSKLDLWNFLNPLFFMIIYLFLNFLANKENKLLKMLMILIMMLTVENHIRTQTYTWIMGTTYVIPLMLSLIYFFVVKHSYLEIKKKLNIVLSIFLNLILFYIGLTMENIAGTVLLAIIIINLYFFYRYKKIDIQLFINGIISGLSLSILRLSPGANGRLAEYHPEWVAKSLAEKLTFNIKYFVELTFTNNKVILIVFILLLLFVVKRSQIKKTSVTKIFCGIQLIALLMIAAPNLSEWIYQDGMNWLSWGYTLFWLLFIVSSFYLIYNYVDLNKEIILFLILLGGASSVCLMISPIFSSRSLLYFVYFILLCNLYLFDNLIYKLKYEKILNSICVILLLPIIYNYYRIYSEVARIHSERMMVIEYYLDHPEEEEAWIPRIPDDSIHSANIEEDNEYHMQTFKEYYGLPENMKIVFYNKEGE